jgi:hypothetical protein
VKILIISKYFPPENAIASLRPYSWAEYWSRDGHDITVLTTLRSPQNNDLNLDCSSFNVIRIPYLRSLRSKVTISKKEYGHALSSGRHNIIVTLLKNIKDLLISFSDRTGCFSQRYPSFADIWAARAKKIILKTKYDVVISTGGPYSVHRIGLKMKKKYPESKWIVDWRDLWTKNHIFKGLVIFHFHERCLENKFHKNADLITTVSKPLADILQKLTKTKVETIYNGFSSKDYEQIISKERTINKVFTIAYTGTVYKKFQDPTPLFRAVYSLKQMKKITSNDLKIQFAGPPSDVGNLAEEYNVSEFCLFLGLLQREEALQLQYDADALLFLEFTNPDVPGIMTGKLFEYLFIAREIIAIGIDDTTSAGELINNTRTGICLGSDIKKIEDYLIARIVNKTTNAKEKNEKLISTYDRKVQAERLFEYISIL